MILNLLGIFDIYRLQVKERTPYKVRLSLIDPEGNTVHASEEEVEVFPAFSAYALANKNVVIGVVGKEGGRAWDTAQLLGANVCLWDKNLKPQIVFVDDANLEAALNEELTTYLEQGGIALLFEQKIGSWQICGKKITIENVGGRDFVSRKTGHKLVKGFRANDFAYWYSSSSDRIDSVSTTVINCENITPIIVTSNWSPIKVPVVGEVNIGKGKLFVNQLHLIDAIKVNPIVFDFYNKIINYSKVK